MSSPSHPKVGPSEKVTLARAGIASVLWLGAAAVAGHFLWAGVPWIVVLLLAAMAELIVLTAWLLGSTFHDPAKRWELPPNPADAQRGWRGVLARARWTVQAGWGLVLQKIQRRPLKT